MLHIKFNKQEMTDKLAWQAKFNLFPWSLENKTPTSAVPTVKFLGNVSLCKFSALYWSFSLDCFLYCFLCWFCLFRTTNWRKLRQMDTLLILNMGKDSDEPSSLTLLSWCDCCTAGEHGTSFFFIVVYCNSLTSWL